MVKLAIPSRSCPASPSRWDSKAQVEKVVNAPIGVGRVEARSSPHGGEVGVAEPASSPVQAEGRDGDACALERVADGPRGLDCVRGVAMQAERRGVDLEIDAISRVDTPLEHDA